MHLGGAFRSWDRLELYACRWAPAGEVAANVLLIHGYAEHSGRYEGLATALNEMGYALHAYDLRGHGQSAGKRGYIPRFRTLVKDHREYVRHLGKLLEGRPLFMMGHSLGGLILAQYACEHNPCADGLIFSSPLLQLPGEVSSLLLRLSGVLSTLLPGLPVARIQPEDLTRDPGVIKDYISDPLVYRGSIPARTGAEIHMAIERVAPRLPEITAPLYIMHGNHDRVVPVSASTSLPDSVGSTDATLRIYDGAYHELLHDLDKELVLEELCAWLARQRAPAEEAH